MKIFKSFWLSINCRHAEIKFSIEIQLTSKERNACEQIKFSFHLICWEILIWHLTSHFHTTLYYYSNTLMFSIHQHPFKKYIKKVYFTPTREQAHIKPFIEQFLYIYFILFFFILLKYLALCVEIIAFEGIVCYHES